MPFQFKSSISKLDAWMLLNQTYDSISHCKEKLSAKVGITMQQVGILMAIKFIDPPPTETQIAEWVDKKLNSVSTILDRMAIAGLIERVEDPQDRRTYRVRVTKTGQNFSKTEVAHRAELIKEIMGSLSEEETQTLIKLLTKVRLQALRHLHQDKSLKEVNMDDRDPIVQHLRLFPKKKK
jgi:MarR family transcriptional regulator, 2-MHQ and catechol-resistance regulon repressor